VGKAVPVQVLRNGELTDLTVTLGRRETAEAASAPQNAAPVEPETKELLGLTLSEITPQLTEELQLTQTEGLVITNVAAGSDAEGKGLKAGDVITEAGQQRVMTLSDLEDRIDEATEAGRKSLLLLIRRGGDPRFVALTIE